MSLLFAERVRGGLRYLNLHQIVPPDSQEFVAVLGSIFELAFERLSEDFDFPETWKKDPESYRIFMYFTVRLLLEIGPGDKMEMLRGLQEELTHPRPRPEPRTNRERKRQRRIDLNIKYAFSDSRAHDPKRYGRVREHTQAELDQYLDKAAARAATAFGQWKAGVPLAQIDA